MSVCAFIMPLVDSVLIQCYVMCESYKSFYVNLSIMIIFVVYKPVKSTSPGFSLLTTIFYDLSSEFRLSADFHENDGCIRVRKCCNMTLIPHLMRTNLWI